MENHKFKIGQIVMHKASNVIVETKMVVLAFGTLENETDKEKIYALSYEGPSGEFRRVILQESEIVSVNVFDKE